MFPIVRGVPAITTEQMIEVDRVMVEDLDIDLVRMMENAGRSLAVLAMTLFEPRTVQVLAGSGGNGGGALVAARHLSNRGVEVRVTTTTTNKSTAATTNIRTTTPAIRRSRKRIKTSTGRSCWRTSASTTSAAI